MAEQVRSPRAGLVNLHSGGIGDGLDQHSPRCLLIDVIDGISGIVWIDVPGTSHCCLLSATYLASRYHIWGLKVPRLKLTKAVIDGLPVAPKDTVFWDANLPAFGVKVTPAGRKVFIVLYRVAGAGSKL